MSSSFHVSKKRSLAVVLALCLCLICATVLYGVYIWDNQTPDYIGDSDMSSVNKKEQLIVDGVRYTLKDDIQPILFLGIDSYETEIAEGYINGQQADFLMLMVLDHSSKSYSVLHINRDTVARFQTLGITGESGGYETAQIALSHAYGTGGKDSSRNTTKAVSTLLYGVSIPHYVTLRMNAISELNDAVGGVSLDLMDDFTDLDPTFTKDATVTLKGEQALAYVQYRGTLEDSTNISRMARQRQYLTAWMQCFRTAASKDDKFISGFVMDVSSYLTTDLSVDEISKLSDSFFEYESNGILEVAGESSQVNNYMEFHVDEDALQKQVLDLFYTPVASN